MQLTFTHVTEENSELFHTLMAEYARELDENQNRSTDPVMLHRWTDSVISKAKGDAFCLLKLCYAEEQPVGFLLAKIDRPDDRGYIRAGHGYIIEFYVKPEYRRNGYGRAMLAHIERFYAKNGVAQMYLTADPVTGKPFWSAMGFIGTGEYSPDNGQEIFEKSL